MKQPDSLIEEADISDKAVPSALWQLIEVVQASADVIISIDEHERISFVNAAAEEMFGYMPQELTGQPLSLLIPPTYRSGHSRHIEDFRNNSQSARMMAQRRPVHGIRKDGRMVPLEISILRHKRPGPFSLSAIVRDISERLSHKNQITEHDRRYLAMLESRRRATALLTPTGRIIDLNRIALDDGAVSKDDIVGRNIWDAPWWSGEERRSILRDLIDGIGIGKSQTFVMEIRTPENRTRKVELSLKAMSPDGVTLDFIIADWESQKKTDGNRSQETRMRLDLLQRSARIGSWEWAFASDELYWSEETYRIFGQPPDGDKPSYDMTLACIHPEDREAVHNVIQATIADRDEFSLFYRLAFSDGREKLVHHAGRLLRSNDGKPLQILSTVQDITETSMREKELLDALERLKEKGLAKSRFLANLSHELRTPLNIIIGFSEFIHNSENLLNTEKINEYAHYIADSGHRLLGLVNDIILALRLDARMVQPQDGDVSLQKTLHDAIGQQKEAAAEKSMTLSLNISDDILLAGDEMLLSRALSAVLNNAIKFGQADGRVTITATTGKDNLTVIIEDDGLSMRDEQFNDLHEPFGQIDNDLDRHHEGVGLGLTIVRGVFKLHGGDVNIRRSTLGGVCVELSIPNKRIITTRT